MRNRISAVWHNVFQADTDEIVELIGQETGAKVPLRPRALRLEIFFEKCEVRDLLDSITLIYNYYSEYKSTKAKPWHKFISRVFKEENVGYRLDEKGGVHFFIDEEFERNRSAVIAGLSSQPAVKESFEKSYSFLDQDPPDTGSAIRSIFEALEILYKHIVKAEGKDRLNSLGVQKKLKPILQKAFESNPTASTAADHMMDSLCDWIDAGHMYRHGQRVEEPSPPPLDFAVLFLSQGAGFVRFLLPFAEQKNPAGAKNAQPV